MIAFIYWCMTLCLTNIIMLSTWTCEDHRQGLMGQPLPRAILGFVEGNLDLWWFSSKQLEFIYKSRLKLLFDIVINLDGFEGVRDLGASKRQFDIGSNKSSTLP